MAEYDQRHRLDGSTLTQPPPPTIPPPPPTIAPLPSTAALAAIVSRPPQSKGVPTLIIPPVLPTAAPAVIMSPPPQSTAVPGPGPTTVANRIVTTVTDIVRSFRDIEQEDDEGEAAIRYMDTVGYHAKIKEKGSSDMEVDELEEDEGGKKGKGKARGVERTPEPRAHHKKVKEEVKEESDSDDWDRYKRSPKLAAKHGSVRRSNLTAATTRYRMVGRSTGDYFDPPCSTCHLAGRVCERNIKGGSCTQCKVYKRACEYAGRGGTRRVKSKPTIDSEEDDDEDDDDEKNDRQMASEFQPRTPRPRRAASKRAMQAIRGEIVIPTLQPLAPTGKKPPTGRRHAAVKAAAKKGEQRKNMFYTH